MRSSKGAAWTRRSGFTLPAVLTVTGVVTLIFVVAMTAMTSLRAEAASARQRVQFLQRAMTAEAGVSWLLATEPVGNRGLMLGAVRSAGFEADAASVVEPSVARFEWLADGTSYRMSESLVVRLRDQAGMINLLRLDPEQIMRLADLLRMPAAEASVLAARLTDYTDPDDLRGVRGAEARDYGHAIPNRPLVRTGELLSVLGVREAVADDVWRRVRGEIAVDHTQPGINANTASVDALMVIFGMSRGQAEATVVGRRRQPFYSIRDISQVSGATLIDQLEGVATFPSGRFILDIRDGSSPWTYRARLVLTPAGIEQPLWIDQTELTEAPRRAVADMKNAVVLPDPLY